MGFELRDKRAIVTGASSGIGKGIAIRFAHLGAKVVLTARRQSALEEVANEIRGAGGVAVVAPGDVTRTEDVTNVVERAVSELGGVDVLVNCAGVSKPAAFEATAPERVREHIAVNYLGPVDFCRAALPHLKAQSSGYIVNVASMAGLKGLPSFCSYGASKAALVRFSEALQHEVKAHGVTVSVLCPPGVHTPMVDDDWDSHPDWFKESPIVGVGEVVTALVKGMRRGEPIIFVNAATRAMYVAFRYSPGLFTRFFNWRYGVDR